MSMLPNRADVRLSAIVWNYEIVDEYLFQESVDREYCNYVYGAVTQQEHERLNKFPIDGVITDYLERARNTT